MKEMCLDHVQDHIQEALDTLSLTPETLSLLTLFPVLYVAWADHRIDPSELKAILELAEESELSTGAHGELLGKWLQKEPPAKFWEHGLYLVRVLLGPDGSAQQDELLERAQRVGKATEGLFGVPYTLGSSTEEALNRVSAALGKLEPTEESQAEGELTPSETQWQQPIRWTWVQMSSMLIVLLLGGVIYIQQSQGYSFLVPNTHGKSMPLSSLFDGAHLLLYVLLPLVPFVFGGALLGWKSEGEIYTEAIFAALIPLAMYWIVWLAIGAHMKQQVWDAKRMVLLFTFTLLAGAVSAAGAFFGDRLNSGRAVGS